MAFSGAANVAGAHCCRSRFRAAHLHEMTEVSGGTRNLPAAVGALTQLQQCLLVCVYEFAICLHVRHCCSCCQNTRCNIQLQQTQLFTLLLQS